jgi:putative oxidoreductase
LSALASACLAALMIGAIGTHAIHSEWPMFAIAIAIFCLAAWRGWFGRTDIVQLFTGRRS